MLTLDASSDGHYLASGGLDRHIHIWDTRTREHLQIIEKPMDLGTVRKKIKESGYKNACQMYEDVKLTFENAMKYNEGVNDDIHVIAKTLLDTFEEKWQNLLPRVEKAESQLLKEKSHKRLYKTLVLEATYGNTC